MTGIITSDMTTTISFVFLIVQWLLLPLVALMMWYSRDNESAMTFNKSSLSSTNSSFFLSIFSVIFMVSSLFREDITERESDTVSGKGRILPVYFFFSKLFFNNGQGDTKCRSLIDLAFNFNFTMM